MFTGTDGDRPKANDILVLLLNGRTADAALASEYAEKLIVRGVRIIAVAVGSETESFIDQAELMASSLQDMRRTNFDHLNEIGNYVLSGVCTMVTSTREPGRESTVKHDRVSHSLVYIFAHLRSTSNSHPHSPSFDRRMGVDRTLVQTLVSQLTSTHILV